MKILINFLMLMNFAGQKHVLKPKACATTSRQTQDQKKKKKKDNAYLLLCLCVFRSAHYAEITVR